MRLPPSSSIGFRAAEASPTPATGGFSEEFADVQSQTSNMSNCNNRETALLKQSRPFCASGSLRGEKV